MMYALYKKQTDGFKIISGYFNSAAASSHKLSRFDYIVAYENEKDLDMGQGSMMLERIWNDEALKELSDAARSSNVGKITEIIKKYNAYMGCITCGMTDADLVAYVKMKVAKIISHREIK